jgi:hypothetical protein
MEAFKGMNKNKTTALRTVLAVLFAVFTGISVASAAPMDGYQSCDTEYWDSMKNRAWLEAEREIVQNQHLIFKPDSVLEYTCFQDWTLTSAAGSGGIFSGGTLSGRLNSLVLGGSAGVNQYLNNNFGHDMLGGREPIAVSCSVMAQVWQAAKCMNFVDTAHGSVTLDGFHTFLEYADNPDPRIFPTPCTGTKPTWEAHARVALNTPDVRTTDARVDIDPYIRNPYNEHLELIKPKLVPGACGAAVMTGVQVHTIPGAAGDYADGICTNPGCTFVKGGGCQ